MSYIGPVGKRGIADFFVTLDGVFDNSDGSRSAYAIAISKGSAPNGSSGKGTSSAPSGRYLAFFFFFFFFLAALLIVKVSVTDSANGGYKNVSLETRGASYVTRGDKLRKPAFLTLKFAY